MQVLCCFHSQVSSQSVVRNASPPFGRGVPQTGRTEGVSDREGHLLAGHVHLMISIPPKYFVSPVVEFIEGKSAIHLARVYGERKQSYAGQSFWARGYFVSTVGRWLEDEIQSDGTVKRIRKSDDLGSLKDFPTKRLAQRELDGRFRSSIAPHIAHAQSQRSTTWLRSGRCP